MPRTTETFDRMLDEYFKERERQKKGAFCPYIEPPKFKFCQESAGCGGCAVLMDAMERAKEGLDADC
jgi:hypothetical protein